MILEYCFSKLEDFVREDTSRKPSFILVAVNYKVNPLYKELG